MVAKIFLSSQPDSSHA